ncbi:MAG: multidrug MFS transporter [Acidobacteria bacterium]|nr:MAG: multidrug MFS transporter [Acidobacteriota bacterium]
MTRRDALRLLPVSFSLTMLAQNNAPRPFKVDIPQATLNRILARVKSTRLPDRLDAPDWRYGANWNYMKSLAEYWITQFDWKKAQANLNRYPQFIARVDDYDIHFYHVKGRGPKPLPLILTHGWPGSVFEFLEAIGPLSDPARHGGSAEDAFDIIVPSIPGFGFSSKPKQPIGPPTTARLWHSLMTSLLGYSRFGAQGGDWGNAITLALAREFPQSIVGIHLNATGGAAPAGDLSDEERAWQQTAAAYRTQELDYFNEQQHKPGTVAFALYDNPIGTAGWIVEKFKIWSDSANDIESVFSKDQILTNVMIYLVTDTVATAVWFYRGALDDRAAPIRGKLETPTGFASFPGEMPSLNPPRSFLERNFNLVQYTKMPKGGHFACLEQPKLFVDDVRSFFRKVRL